MELTKYKQGSLRELWTLAWPAMLTAASGCLMIFGDRFILSFYSQDAFNANIGSMPWYWTFLFTFFNIILSAGVFVGQFNGEKRFEKIGPVISQMLFVCASLWIFVIPLVIWGAPFLLAKNLEELGIPYLRITFLFMPINCAAAGAFASFFTGRGKTWIVTCVAIVTNLVNIVLDVWFVFGWGIVPEMGIRGAAWATGLSQCLGFAIFAFLYFQKKHRKLYNTTDFRLDIPLIKRCLKIGTPNAVSCFLNCLTWSWMSQILAIYVCKEDFTAYGIAHSIYVIFFFAIEGIADGVSIVTSNAIGSQKYDVVYKSLKSAWKLSAIFCILVFFGMIVYPNYFIEIFLPKDSSHGIVFNLAKNMLFWTWVLFVIECFWFVLLKVLFSAGDTRFSMIVNVSCCWLLGFLPTLVLVVMFGFGAIVNWQVVCFEYLFRTLFLFYRFKSGKWKNIKLTDNLNVKLAHETSDI